MASVSIEVSIKQKWWVLPFVRMLRWLSAIGMRPFTAEGAANFIIRHGGLNAYVDDKFHSRVGAP